MSLEPLYQNRGLTVRLLLVIKSNPVAEGQERSLHVIGVFQKEVFTTGQTGEAEVPGAQDLELPRAASWHQDNGGRG